MMTCVTDYSVITGQEIVVEVDRDTQEKETQVVVDYYQQPEKPSDLDVLVILDTSCSMSDNFDNVSAKLTSLAIFQSLILIKTNLKNLGISHDNFQSETEIVNNKNGNHIAAKSGIFPVSPNKLNK